MHIIGHWTAMNLGSTYFCKYVNLKASYGFKNDRSQLDFRLLAKIVIFHFYFSWWRKRRQPSKVRTEGGILLVENKVGWSNRIDQIIMDKKIFFGKTVKVTHVVKPQIAYDFLELGFGEALSILSVPGVIQEIVESAPNLAETPVFEQWAAQVRHERLVVDFEFCWKCWEYCRLYKIKHFSADKKLLQCFFAIQKYFRHLVAHVLESDMS